LLQEGSELRRPVALAFSALLLLTALAGCGEVYADLDVRKVASAEAWLEPAQVVSASIDCRDLHARLSGSGTATVQTHGFDGSQNVTLVNPDIGIYPGRCKDDCTLSPGEQPGAEDLFGDTGEHLFCVNMEVGPFTETTSLSIPIRFWDGVESVETTVSLTVNVANPGGVAP
jgi:hypothetical protein